MQSDGAKGTPTWLPLLDARIYLYKDDDNEPYGEEGAALWP
jgi:hypothetical protein